MASIGPRRKAGSLSPVLYEFYRFWRNFDELGQKLPLIFIRGKHNIIDHTLHVQTLYSVHTYTEKSNTDTEKSEL